MEEKKAVLQSQPSSGASIGLDADILMMGSPQSSSKRKGTGKRKI